MKLKLTDNHFHFTISRDEIKRLLEGEAVKQIIRLGGSSFNFAIKPYNEDIFKLYLTPLSIVLFVSESHLRTLNQHRPATSQIRTMQDETCIILDIGADEPEQDKHQEDGSVEDDTSSSSTS